MTVELFPPYLAATVLVLFFTWMIICLWQRNQNLPPGPWGIPFFGYYPFLSPRPYKNFTQLSKQYGDIFSFRSAGGSLFVVLNGSTLIKNSLVNRADEFIGKPLESNLLDWISDGLGVSQEEGSSWKEHRRYFLSTVKNFGFGKLEIESTILNEIHTLKEDLYKANGQPTDFSFHIAYALNSIIGQVMFATKLDKYGDLFKKLSDGIHELIDIVADHRFMLVGLPFKLSLYLLPSSSKIRQARACLRDTVKDIIDEHVRTLDPNFPRDYVDSFLCEMEKIKASGEKKKETTFTMERLLAIAMNMTLEGTAAYTVRRLLTEASSHVEEQKEVQKELDAVLGPERQPSWLDKQRLPVTEAFIMELYRTAQAFPLTNHYSNFETTTIKGYRIPKRTIIVGNLWTVNQDPLLYENPNTFNLRRFLDTDGKRIKTDGPYPFSLGKRECVGQALAQMEVFLIVASLLQSFTLYPGGKEGVLRAIPRN